MENIFAGIITIAIYGIILSGCIIPVLFIVGTKHNIEKLGYKKYIFMIIGLEVLLLLAAAVVLLLLKIPFYISATWNKGGIINMDFFIMVYQVMLKFIVPVYLLAIVAIATYGRLKR